MFQESHREREKEKEKIFPEVSFCIFLLLLLFYIIIVHEDLRAHEERENADIKEAIVESFHHCLISDWIDIPWIQFVCCENISQDGL